MLTVEPRSKSVQPVQNRVGYAIYALALAVSISTWFISIRMPLLQDETGSYWQISAGFSQIWPRLFTTFPAYYYILWLSTKIIGTSEIALRIPSVLAMLGAAYLLYLAARELFKREIAIIAVAIFCLNPIVMLESINIRPYAFGVLATNAAIFILLRLRRSNSNWLAALFGFSTASILYFHYLFAVILPALAICFFTVKIGDRKIAWRQFGIAAAGFILACLPLIPGLRYIIHTSGTHAYELAPKLSDLFSTFAPDLLPFIFIAVALAALLIAALTTRRPDSVNRFERWHVIFCASLALIPILILYGMSTGTSIHLFSVRYRLIAVPGIALCWALLVSLVQPRALRLLFYVAFVAATAFLYFTFPSSRTHIYTWKYAVAFVQKDASVDNASVLICSDYIEADYAPMPLTSAKDSILFSQLTYYKLSVPVVPMPRDLNSEAIRVGSQFLAEATPKHERFLAFADPPSYKVLDWLVQTTSGTYDAHNLGVFNGVKILEFVPRAQKTPDAGTENER